MAAGDGDCCVAAGRLGLVRPIATAAGRAVLQLAVVALMISVVLDGVAWSLLFAGLMFGVAVTTTCRRIGAPPCLEIPFAVGGELCDSVEQDVKRDLGTDRFERGPGVRISVWGESVGSRSTTLSD